MEPTHEKTIVLVDDDPLFLDETARLLQEAGLATYLCSRPALAHRLIRRTRPDAVLLDQDMPEICGLDVLRQIRDFSATATIPVLFLTAHDNRDLRITGFESGLDDFIAKPFEGQELLLRLQAILRRTARHSPSPLTENDTVPVRNESFSARAILLQVKGYQNLERSDSHNQRSRVDRTLSLLFHRLRDLLANEWRLRPTGIASRRAGAEEILLYISPRDRKTDTPRQISAETFRRLATAGNRLLTRLFQSDHLLRSEIGGPLARAPLPVFRIFDFWISGDERQDITLPARLARLELERPHRAGEVPHRSFEL